MEDSAELIEGAIDFHVHSSPSIFPRYSGDLEVGLEAKKAGLGGILIKAHEGSSLERALVTERALGGGLRVFGSLVLNHYVGGFNPAAVEAYLLMGTRVIWMPTVSAKSHWEHHGGPGFPHMIGGISKWGDGLSLFDEKGKLRSQVLEILDLIRHERACICTGHLSVPETLALFREAKARGIERFVITHPDMDLVGMPLSLQEDLGRQGAFLEKTFLSTWNDWGGISIEEMVHTIRRIGAERCVISSDLGQAINPPPVEGLARFASILLQSGIDAKWIQRMLKDNPLALVGTS